jgi:glycine/D-amino acid oxidase-like deaminating enzyme
MRTWGGVEATDASASHSISLIIKQRLEALLGVKLSKPRSAVGFIELLACDELPIIGPMFGNTRILIASGFMNSSVSFRLAAGRGLAEFIADGQSPTVSEAFLPRRLRSLPESS